MLTQINPLVLSEIGSIEYNVAIQEFKSIINRRNRGQWRVSKIGQKRKRIIGAESIAGGSDVVDLFVLSQPAGQIYVGSTLAG